MIDIRHTRMNNVNVDGTILSNLEEIKTNMDGTFYTFSIGANRMSDTSDVLRIIIAKETLDSVGYLNSGLVHIFGKLKYFIKNKDCAHASGLYILASEVLKIDSYGKSYLNEVNVKGFILKKPVLRKTPFGRIICDILIKTEDFQIVPCIVWGRNANYISDLTIKTKVEICGRMQSREYQKLLDNGEIITNTTYEISANKIRLIH
ncbi:MAG: single-stranded DNA-binding protein [Clostridia bacterium]|nr:single-stranded DNA-binding protein [Clostridia bacterium]